MSNIIYNGLKEDYQDIIENGYEFKLGDYFKDSWKIIKPDIGRFMGFSFIIIFLLFAGNLLVTAFQFVMFDYLNSFSITNLWYIKALASAILSTISTLIIYFLNFGYFIVVDKIYQGESFTFSDFFDTFLHWKQLAYYQLYNLMFMLIPLVPFIMNLGFIKSESPTLQSLSSILSNEYLTYFLMLPGYYLLISYSFTPFLIMFGKLNYKDAMEISRKIIHKRFLWFVLFYILLIIIAYSGLIALIIGVLISIPFAACSLYLAYHEIVAKKPSAIDNKIEEIGIIEEPSNNDW